MKRILISLIAITTIGLCGIAQAKDKTTDLNEKSINAKCYVELVGGGETISLWRIKPSLLENLSNSIVGKKIIDISSKKSTPNKQKSTIYKAKQCILEEDDFTSPIARAMDKDIPR